MTPEEVHAAVEELVNHGDRTRWDDVLEELRSGELVVEVTIEGLLIKPRW